MKKVVNFHVPKIKKLGINQLKEFDGGWFVPFAAGALAGGLLYDSWKALTRAYLNSYREHPDYFEGIPHGR